MNLECFECFNIYPGFISNSEDFYHGDFYHEDFIFDSIFTTSQFKINQETIINLLRAKNYHLINFLGGGGQGEVFEVYRNENSIEKFIVKIYYTKNSQQIEEEIEIMKSFEININTLKLYDQIKGDNMYILVLEECLYSLKDELEMIRDHDIAFTEMKLRQMIFNLLDGIVQLRIYNIAHLDIKPDNILVTKQGNYIFGDFGLSLKINKSDIDQHLSYLSDIQQLGYTFLNIFETYESVNGFSQIIENFKKIVNENMLKSNGYNREDCQNLHELFFNQIYNEIHSEFLVYYFEEISAVKYLKSYDNNKDIPFFSEIQLYYFLKKEQIAHLLHYDSESLAQVQMEIGFTYAKLGNFQQALHYFLASLKIRQQISQESNQSIIESLYYSGSAYCRLGQTQIGLEYLFKSLEMGEIVFGGKYQPLTGDSLNSISHCYYHTQQLDKALEYSLKSLNLRKKMFKGNHPDIQQSLTNTGIYYQEMGQYKESIKYYLSSLEMIDSLYQGNNPLKSNLLNNIGYYYNVIGQFDLSLSYHLQSVEMSRQIYKDNHPFTATFLSNLSDAYRLIQDQENAFQTSLKSLEMFRHLFKEYHPMKQQAIDVLWQIIQSFKWPIQ